MTSAPLFLRDYSASLNNGEQPKSNLFRGDTMAPLFLRSLALPLSRQNHLVITKSFRSHFEIIFAALPSWLYFEIISKVISKSSALDGCPMAPSFQNPFRKSFRNRFEVISKTFSLPCPCGAPRRCPPLCHTPRDPANTSDGRRAEGSFRSRNKVSVGDSFAQRILRAKNPAPR